MSSLHLIKQKAPITTNLELSYDAPYNRKYAPKFLNYLNIFDKVKLQLRTRYIKKISFLRCPSKSWSEGQEEWKPNLLKITKRFGKTCKGQEDLDPEFLSSFLSLEKCRLRNISSLPFYFKIGRFPKLTLEFEMEAMNVPVPKPQVSQIARNLNRFYLLKELHIKFDNNTLDIAIPLLLELQKLPRLITSLQSFGLHYKNTQHDEIGNFQNCLIDLKNITQSVTHLIFDIQTDQISNLYFQNFHKLNYLDITFTPPDSNDFLELIPLLSLTNLETLVLRIPLNTQAAIESFFNTFQPPKSLKKLGLFRTRDDSSEDFLPLSKFIKEDKISTPQPSKKSFFSNLFQCVSFKRKPQVHSALKFYERFGDLNQLSDLTLSFQNAPEISDADFLFIAPILQRCKRLKRLAFTTTCSSSCIKSRSGPQEHSGNLQWAQILQVLEPSKDTLEYLKIKTCKVNFEEIGPSGFTLKELKNLSIAIRTMEAKNLDKVSSIIPKGLKKCKLEYQNIVLHNEQEINEIFNYLQEIPRHLQLSLAISFSEEVTKEVLEKAFLNYLTSAKIHGYLSLDFKRLSRLNPRQLQKSIRKVINLAWTGYLDIDYDPFGNLFELKRTNIRYSLR